MVGDGSTAMDGSATIDNDTTTDGGAAMDDDANGSRTIGQWRHADGQKSF